jgi:triosephosphate isomerase
MRSLNIIFCIGETLKEKRNKKTFSILSKQIKIGLDGIKNLNKLIVAYEPVWSIGTGIIPSSNDLYDAINFIKKKIKNKSIKVLYGGSVNNKNINELKKIKNLDGFLIGGASQDPKKFIDIIEKTYN